MNTLWLRILICVSQGDWGTYSFESAINPCSIDLTSIYGLISLTEKFWGFEERACGRVCGPGPWSRWCISSTWGAQKCSPILWVAWRQYCIWRCKLPFPVLLQFVIPFASAAPSTQVILVLLPFLMQLVVLVLEQKINMIWYLKFVIAPVDSWNLVSQWLGSLKC